MAIALGVITVFDGKKISRDHIYGAEAFPL